MSVRIPIRKWEKVTLDPYNPYRAPSLDSWRTEDRYKLQVVINGEILDCNVRVPHYLSERNPEALREHVVASLSHQIGAIIADEVRRSIV